MESEILEVKTNYSDATVIKMEDIVTAMLLLYAIVLLRLHEFKSYSYCKI